MVMGLTSELTILKSRTFMYLIRFAQQDFDITTFYSHNDCKIIS